MRRINMMALFLLAAAAAFPAKAQQSQNFGDYEVHYNTINTNVLTPDVASAYGIQRAGTQAMLNVTVLRKGDREPVDAQVTATATNGQYNFDFTPPANSAGQTISYRADFTASTITTRSGSAVDVSGFNGVACGSSTISN